MTAAPLLALIHTSRWIEQEDHMRVAGEAARVYVEAREAGENDVGRLLMKIGGRQRLENKGHAQENDVYSREHSGGTHARMLFGGPKGAMEQTDMGECFVGPWDVANMAADVLMRENDPTIAEAAASGDDSCCG
eukprot:scaffold258469_cov40-Tisochrysis_lutea.AAC.2